MPVFLCVLVLANSAYAQSSSTAPNDLATASAPDAGTMPIRLTMSSGVSPNEVQEHWYGWQTLTTDAVWVGLLGVAVTAIAVDPSVSDEGAPNAAAIIALVPVVPTYLFGAPIVHAAHGHWDKAGASLALRLGAPLALGYLGTGLGRLTCPGTTSETSNYHCVNVETDIGAIAGLVAAISLDAALLARESVPSRTSAATLSPTLSLNRSGFSVGLGAEF